LYDPIVTSVGQKQLINTLVVIDHLAAELDAEPPV
jgi:hypothetical protein